MIDTPLYLYGIIDVISPLFGTVKQQSWRGQGTGTCPKLHFQQVA